MGKKLVKICTIMVILVLIIGRSKLYDMVLMVFSIQRWKDWFQQTIDQYTISGTNKNLICGKGRFITTRFFILNIFGLIFFLFMESSPFKNYIVLSIHYFQWIFLECFSDHVFSLKVQDEFHLEQYTGFKSGLWMR